RFGNLLFYTNGVNVYNRLHQLMPNGTGLFGGFNQNNSVLIIPFLDGSSRYYIFTAEGFTGSASNGYCYSIVDMTLNGGLGDVSVKNVNFFSPSSSKMTAIRHANGYEYWIICKDLTNRFYAFRLSCAGLSSTPVVSAAGYDSENEPARSIGMLRGSLDGKKLATTYYGLYPAYFQLGLFEVMKFDNSTGIVSNPVRLPLQYPYGIEFSPDSRLVYLTNDSLSITPQVSRVIQLQVEPFLPSGILSSYTVVSEKSSEEGEFGQLQLGPDQKIYRSNGGRSFLDVINNPNAIGSACGYNKDQVDIGGRVMNFSLPYFVSADAVNPNVQFSYSVDADCRTVSFQAQTYIQGNSLSFFWDFGDGNQQSQLLTGSGDTTYTSITHVFPADTDTFFVELSLTADAGCGRGSITKAVVLRPPPPQAGFDFTMACNDLSVAFTNTSDPGSNPAVSYKWEFFDKAGSLLGTSTQQDAVFAFPAFDTAGVRLIVKSSLACVDSDTLEKTFVLKARPSASFSFTESCGSLTASFIGTSAVAADTIKRFYWSFGEAAATGSTGSVIHEYAGFGSYTVKFVAESGSGCLSDTAVETITLRAKPLAGIVYDTDACEGKPFILSDNSTVDNGSISQFYWNAGGVVFNASSIQTSLPAGNALIEHAVTSTQGCTSDTVRRTVLVESLPLVMLRDTVGCSDTPLSLEAQVSLSTGTIAAYEWTTTNGFSANSSTAVFSFPDEGSYGISLNVTTVNGCKNAPVQALISIDAPPIPSFTHSPPCVGSEIQLTNTTPNAASYGYTWLVDNMPISSQTNTTYSLGAPGRATVRLEAASPNGCKAQVSKTLDIERFELGLTASVSEAYSGERVELLTSSSIAYSVLSWSPEQAFVSQAVRSQRIEADSSLMIHVVAVSVGGCRDTAFLALDVEPLNDIYIPSAFTPNGDGKNDLLRVLGPDIAELDFRIFNRWGEMVFLTRDKSRGWDGSFRGKPLTTGSYVYLASILKKDGSRITKRGMVTIIR
ncbi:MAG TPA: PKD domain-containing protein, partial [Flavisolibacter sp.]|nr:PKD domain-containing protein [Flavisolibacter sp.]